ncbi:hypothetical protein C8R43DRAFT_1167298 [Mycena crocata]|nr:hypothetical protein C8R43DRAFT_1167298 [Mycena crocata]
MRPHVLLAPYTKVEESYNLHAVHDVLMYGVSPSSLPNVRSFSGQPPETKYFRLKNLLVRSARIFVGLLPHRPGVNTIKPSQRSVKASITLLAFSAVVFRAELVELLAGFAMQSVFSGHTTFWRVFDSGIYSALTLSIDSYFSGEPVSVACVCRPGARLDALLLPVHVLTLPHDSLQAFISSQPVKTISSHATLAKPTSNGPSITFYQERDRSTSALPLASPRAHAEASNSFRLEDRDARSSVDADLVPRYETTQLALATFHEAPRGCRVPRSGGPFITKLAPPPPPPLLELLAVDLGVDDTYMLFLFRVFCTHARTRSTFFLPAAAKRAARHETPRAGEDSD